MSVMDLLTEHQRQTLSWGISRKCAYVHMQVNAASALHVRPISKMPGCLHAASGALLVKRAVQGRL